MIAELPEHHAELDGRRGIETVLVVEIDSIQGRNGGLQSRKILIKNAGRPGALRLYQRGYVFPVSVIRGANAERDPLHRPLFQLRHVSRKIGIVLVAHINSARGQGKLSVEIQIASAADLDTPHDCFGEARILNLRDVRGCVFVKRAAAKNPGKSSLSRRALDRETHCQKYRKKNCRTTAGYEMTSRKCDRLFYEMLHGVSWDIWLEAETTVVESCQGCPRIIHFHAQQAARGTAFRLPPLPRCGANTRDADNKRRPATEDIFISASSINLVCRAIRVYRSSWIALRISR